MMDLKMRWELIHKGGRNQHLNVHWESVPVNTLTDFETRASVRNSRPRVSGDSVWIDRVAIRKVMASG